MSETSLSSRATRFVSSLWHGATPAEAARAAGYAPAASVDSTPIMAALQHRKDSLRGGTLLRSALDACLPATGASDESTEAMVDRVAEFTAPQLYYAAYCFGLLSQFLGTEIARRGTPVPTNPTTN